MKKNNNSEDLKDDSDELRKKKPSAGVVSDQMVPVPESRPFQEERNDINSKNDEKNKEYLSLESKECNDALEMHDPLFASGLYEDVNSPEDFDDYDDYDNKECFNEKNAAQDSGETVKGSHESSSDEIESVQKCYNVSETAPNCFDTGQSVQNSVVDGNSPDNCFDEGKTVQNSFDVKEGTQDSFDVNESTQSHFNTGETTQDCFDAGEASKDCIDAEESKERCCDATELADNSKEDYEQENYIVQEIFDVNEESATYDQDRNSTENYPAERAQEPFVTENTSLSPSVVDLIHREMSPVMDPAPICSVASVEDDTDGVAEEQDREEEGNTEVINYTFSVEEEGVNEKISSDENFAEAPEERGIVPEVEDVTCDSGGETVLVMKHEVCSEECDLSKPNLCSEEEMIYTDHLNSIQSVNEMVFHKRSTVIDTGNICASLHVSDNSVMKRGDNSLVCELPRREAAVVRYCENYETVDVNSVFPKRVCNSVCISPIPQPPVRELYVYDPSAQNMTFCRSSAIIDARSLPVSPHLNGLDSYSFHHVPVESSSNIKNINDAYGHTNAGLCPVLQESRLGFDNRDTKPTKKLPSEEDFMRRIEKTLFESKIETKIDDAIDSKYKAELDLSLPLKKRLRTLAAMSSISCTSEKFVTPKEESFPSYPAKRMISIAELEFARKDLEETRTKSIINDHINKL